MFKSWSLEKIYRTLPFVFCLCILGALSLNPVYKSQLGYDLGLRYYECRLMLEEKLDPADVVIGRVESKGYRYFMDKRPEYAQKRGIHAYPPWEYGIMLPLAILPPTVVALLYSVVNIFALFGLFAFTIWSMRRNGCEREWECLAPLTLFIFSIPLTQCLSLGNFGLLITAAYAGAAWSLTEKKSVFLGVFWALAMLKPQLGIWLAFPIFFKRQWCSAFVAVGICVLLTLVPAIFLHKSPIALILQLLETTSQSAAITHYAAELFAFLHYSSFQGLISILNMACCSLLVGGVSYFNRKSTDGLLLVAPLALCALWGSYSQPHDRMLLVLPFLALMREIARAQFLPKKLSVALICLFIIIGMNTVHLKFFGRVFNPWEMQHFMSKIFVLTDPCLWILTTCTWLYCMGHKLGMTSKHNS